MQPVFSSDTTALSAAAGDRPLSEMVGPALRTDPETFHLLGSRSDVAPHGATGVEGPGAPGPHRRRGRAAHPAGDRPRHPPGVAAFGAGTLPFPGKKSKGHSRIVCPKTLLVNGGDSPVLPRPAGSSRVFCESQAASSFLLPCSKQPT